MDTTTVITDTTTECICPTDTTTVPTLLDSTTSIIDTTTTVLDTTTMITDTTTIADTTTSIADTTTISGIEGKQYTVHSAVDPKNKGTLGHFYGKNTLCGNRIRTRSKICFYQKIHNFYPIITKF